MIDNPFGTPSNIPFFKKDESKKEKIKIREVKTEEVNLEDEINQERIKNEPEYAKILREHGGLESNIGIGHKYWKIRP